MSKNPHHEPSSHLHSNVHHAGNDQHAHEDSIGQRLHLTRELLEGFVRVGIGKIFDLEVDDDCDLPSV